METDLTCPISGRQDHPEHLQSCILHNKQGIFCHQCQDCNCPRNSPVLEADGENNLRKRRLSHTDDTPVSEREPKKRRLLYPWKKGTAWVTVDPWSPEEKEPTILESDLTLSSPHPQESQFSPTANATIDQKSLEIGVATWNINHLNNSKTSNADKFKRKQSALSMFFEQHAWLDLLVLQEINQTSLEGLSEAFDALSKTPSHPEVEDVGPSRPTPQFGLAMGPKMVAVGPSGATSQIEWYPIIFRSDQIEHLGSWAFHTSHKKERLWLEATHHDVPRTESSKRIKPQSTKPDDVTSTENVDAIKLQTVYWTKEEYKDWGTPPRKGKAKDQEQNLGGVSKEDKEKVDPSAEEEEEEAQPGMFSSMDLGGANDKGKEKLDPSIEEEEPQPSRSRSMALGGANDKRKAKFDPWSEEGEAQSSIFDAQQPGGTSENGKEEVEDSVEEEEEQFGRRTAPADAIEYASFHRSDWPPGSALEPKLPAHSIFNHFTIEDGEFLPEELFEKEDLFGEGDDLEDMDDDENRRRQMDRSGEEPGPAMEIVPTDGVSERQGSAEAKPATVPTKAKPPRKNAELNQLVSYRPVIVHKVRVKGSPSAVYVGIVHTSPQGSRLSRAPEYRQIKAILDYADEHTKKNQSNWIIAGDYYIDPESRVVGTSQRTGQMQTMRWAVERTVLTKHNASTLKGYARRRSKPQPLDAAPTGKDGPQITQSALEKPETQALDSAPAGQDKLQVTPELANLQIAIPISATNQTPLTKLRLRFSKGDRFEFRELIPEKVKTNSGEADEAPEEEAAMKEASSKEIEGFRQDILKAAVEYLNDNPREPDLAAFSQHVERALQNVTRQPPPAEPKKATTEKAQSTSRQVSSQPVDTNVLKDRVVDIQRADFEEHFVLTIRLLLNKRADFFFFSKSFSLAHAGLLSSKGHLIRVDGDHRLLNWWMRTSDHAPVGGIFAESAESLKRSTLREKEAKKEKEARHEAEKQLQERRAAALDNLKLAVSDLKSRVGSSVIKLDDKPKARSVEPSAGWTENDQKILREISSPLAKNLIRLGELSIEHIESQHYDLAACKNSIGIKKAAESKELDGYLDFWCWNAKADELKRSIEAPPEESDDPEECKRALTWSAITCARAIQGAFNVWAYTIDDFDFSDLWLKEEDLDWKVD